MMPVNWKETLKAEYATAIYDAVNNPPARNSKLGDRISLFVKPLRGSIDDVVRVLGFDPGIYLYNPLNIKIDVSHVGETPDAVEWKLQDHANRLEHNQITDPQSVLIDAYTVQVGGRKFLLIIRIVERDNIISMHHITLQLDGVCDYKCDGESLQQYYDDYYLGSAEFANAGLRSARYRDFDPIANSVLYVMQGMIMQVDDALGEKLLRYESMCRKDQVPSRRRMLRKEWLFQKYRKFVG
jgi:hypothetical protein